MENQNFAFSVPSWFRSDIELFKLHAYVTEETWIMQIWDNAMDKPARDRQCSESANRH